MAIFALGQELVDVHACDSVAFGRIDAKSFAVEIEVESAGRAFATADAIKGQLLGKITMRLDLIAIAEPVFARDRDIQQGGPQIEEGNIKAATVEGDDGIVMLGNIPEGGQ